MTKPTSSPAARMIALPCTSADLKATCETKRTQVSKYEVASTCFGVRVKVVCGRGWGLG